MNEITIVIHYNNEKKSVSTQDDVILGDLLEQLGARGDIPSGQAWLVCKENSSAALDQSLTLAKNGITNGTDLYLASPGKGGAAA